MKVDVIVIGAGAAGLMAASKSGERGRKTIVLDHAKRPGKKILISGGGRCNFTNYYIEPEKYLCENPHFCKSALSQYTQWDFISLIEKYKISYHEKPLGQLFCDDSAKAIVSMLVAECEKNAVEFSFQTDIQKVLKLDDGNFLVKTSKSDYQCESLVIATGGLSMPKLGATSFAYKLAKQFSLEVLPTKAGLVPLTLHPELKEPLAEVSGVSMPVSISANNITFSEDMLITHRGLSGPAVLQISSYWDNGDIASINLYPNGNFESLLKEAISSQTNVSLKNFLSSIFAKRFAEKFIQLIGFENIPLKQLGHRKQALLIESINNWQVKPAGTEGYRTAEVTIGGVNTDQISSKTMEVKSISGLYFIGEALDVTGWLGGYNFQWAWSSGFVAGKNV
ncbi:NAD(P)/FAD-dependent oxidoreductase [Thalassotalea sp. 1_MG-2023]|uniref:NAD(P)/FAD-dependent oxidoreductase n=1 Tax=Thalassotalea sp. 1_MG-2023 TaxID=3062680 RepID=UPI0026E3DDF6|nr:NAD(P)/FAD-dependent oxidoreductase [Thalassotalea sp. 1_MG-2023]MDO6428922.1 NAD(P)/FAD-dependent oxidoreductase [Thalassotalea sp. 1_MG-2023]